MQTYQNYEQLPQSLQNLYFQSHFSASKINRIFMAAVSKKGQIVKNYTYEIHTLVKYSSEKKKFIKIRLIFDAEK